MQQKEKFYIGKGPSESFIVKDERLGSYNAPFYEFLRSEGFTLPYPSYGHSNSRFCYVNITRRQFEYSKPGIKLSQPIGNVALSIDEFMAVYAIFKKHWDSGECFDSSDAPYIYQSEAVIKARKDKEEQEKRWHEEWERRPIQVSPERLEVLLKDYPGCEKYIRSCVNRKITEENIRYWLDL